MWEPGKGWRRYRPDDESRWLIESPDAFVDRWKCKWRRRPLVRDCGRLSAAINKWTKWMKRGGGDESGVGFGDEQNNKATSGSCFFLCVPLSSAAATVGALYYSSLLLSSPWLWLRSRSLSLWCVSVPFFFVPLSLPLPLSLSLSLSFSLCLALCFSFPRKTSARTVSIRARNARSHLILQVLLLVVPKQME